MRLTTPHPTAPGSGRSAAAAFGVVRFWTFLLAVQIFGAAAATLSANLDRGTVTVGETAELTLVYQGGTPDRVAQVQTGPGLTVQFRGSSQAFSIINGQVNASVTHSYSVVPTTAGEYTLGPFQGQADGKPVVAPAVRLRVTASAPSGNGSPLDRFAFLRVLVPKTNVYVGEPIPVELRLYYIDAQEIQLPQLQAEGFTLGKPTKPAEARTRIDNVDYRVVSIHLAAIPAKAGTLALGPLECQLALRIPTNPRRRRDPNDLFPDPFDLFNNRVELRRVKLTSTPIPVQVQPLPTDGRPIEFAGAVGAFQMTVRASPTNLAVGDPVTLTLEISGQGAFDSLPQPDVQNNAQGFKAYPPNSRIETSDVLGLTGRKIFEQVLIPESQDVREVPAVTFAFFDPSARAYRVARSAPIPLQLRASPTPAAPLPTLTGTNTQESPITREIVHIRPRLGTLASASAPWIERPIHWILNLIPILAWLATFVWRRRREALDRNPRQRRHLAMLARRRTGLAELRQHAANADAAAAAALVFRLLQEGLADPLGCPASGITEAVLEERFGDQSLTPELRQDLHQLFSWCNQVRYAPAQTAAEIEPVVHRLAAVLKQLDSIVAPTPGSISPPANPQPPGAHPKLP